MRIRLIILSLLCGLLAGVSASAADKSDLIPMLSDLARDSAQAQREGEPIILFFSLPGCPYCHVVRNNYLQPLLRDGNRKQRAIIREVDLSSTKSVSAWDGAASNQRGIAQMYKVFVAPTVIFVDATGCMLAAPIIGGDIAGLYGGYLDNAFDAAARRAAGKKVRTPGVLKGIATACGSA
ncbi:hypothetical protein D3C72_186630 [compost metagenome]